MFCQSSKMLDNSGTLDIIDTMKINYEKMLDGLFCLIMFIGIAFVLSQLPSIILAIALSGLVVGEIIRAVTKK